MKYLFTISLFLFSFIGYSQTIFSTNIILPDSVSLEAISVTCNIGYGETNIENVAHNFTITDTSVTTYGVITIYDLKTHYYQRFFANAGASEIKFISGKHSSFVKNFSLNNIFSAQELGEEKLYQFAKKEIDANEDFGRKYYEAEARNDSLNKVGLLLEDNSRKKQFEFIKRNSNLYYCLWLFKFNYVDSKYYENDKLLQVFNRKFKKFYQGYVEANQIEEILLTRKNILIGKVTPKYSAKDYIGNLISSEDLKGKYVLINFWAPWCVPCVKEMPDLAEIHKEYGGDKIRVISINCDENYKNFLTTISKLQMIWTNIPYDPAMIAKFGNFRSIPQVFLMDRAGKIIYSRVENKDFNLRLLKRIVEKLE